MEFLFNKIIGVIYFNCGIDELNDEFNNKNDESELKNKDEYGSIELSEYFILDSDGGGRFFDGRKFAKCFNKPRIKYGFGASGINDSIISRYFINNEGFFFSSIKEIFRISSRSWEWRGWKTEGEEEEEEEDFEEFILSVGEDWRWDWEELDWEFFWLFCLLWLL